MGDKRLRRRLTEARAESERYRQLWLSSSQHLAELSAATLELAPAGPAAVELLLPDGTHLWCVPGDTVAPHFAIHEHDTTTGARTFEAAYRPGYFVKVLGFRGAGRCPAESASGRRCMGHEGHDGTHIGQERRNDGWTTREFWSDPPTGLEVTG